MEFGDHVVQSAMARHAPARLVLAYTQWQLLPLLFRPSAPRKVLLLGLGGGALARWFMAFGAHLTAVEHDPVVIDACTRFFGLGDAEVVEADAHHFVRSHEGHYDLVLCDLFACGGAPHCVSHPAFADACRALLNPRGWTSFNLHAAPWRGQVPSDTTGWDDAAGRTVSDAGTVMEMLAAVSDAPVLKTAVPGQDNVVLLQPKEPRQEAVSRAVIDARAAALETQTQLPFEQMARALYAANGARGRVRLNAG